MSPPPISLVLQPCGKSSHIMWSKYDAGLPKILQPLKEIARKEAFARSPANSRHVAVLNVSFDSFLAPSGVVASARRWRKPGEVCEVPAVQYLPIKYYISSPPLINRRVLRLRLAGKSQQLTGHFYCVFLPPCFRSSSFAIFSPLNCFFSLASCILHPTYLPWYSKRTHTLHTH